MRSIQILVSMVLFVAVVRAPCAEEASPLENAFLILMTGDNERFLTELERLVSEADVSAQILYARLLLRESNYAEAEKLLRPLAVDGDARAQYHLGGLYLDTELENPSAGFAWLELSAKQGYKKAILVRENLEGAPEATNGVLSTTELATFLGSMASMKISSLSTEALRCYRLSREELQVAAEDAVPGCTVALLESHGPTIGESMAIAATREMGRCLNDKVFQAAGVTRMGLLECLPMGSP